MTESEKTRLREMLLTQVPENGDAVGNGRLSKTFVLAARKAGIAADEEDYWEVRKDLIDAGVLTIGRGRGGSVYRPRLANEVASVPTDGAAASVDEVSAASVGEVALYVPLQSTLEAFWIPDNGIDQYVLQITAQQGKRQTGGRWTRPDLALVAIWNYEFVPGRTLEVTTFEVKPLNAFDVTGVFEAAAHSAFAHRNYLVIHVSEAEYTNPDLDRIKDECRRFGVGLVLFTDPSDWNTFEVVIESVPKTPDPGDVNRFIATQFSEDHKARLRKYAKA